MVIRIYPLKIIPGFSDKRLFNLYFVLRMFSELKARNEDNLRFKRFLLKERFLLSNALQI